MTISRIDFEDRKRIATEIARMRELGIEFAQFMIDWSDRHANGKMQSFHAPVRRDAIEKTLKAAPLIGMTAAEIAKAIDIKKETCSSVLYAMVKNKSAFMLKQEKFARYFHSPEALELGREAVEIEKAHERQVNLAKAVKRERIAQVKPLKIKAAKAPKVRKPPKQHQNISIRREAQPAALKKDTPVVVPPGLQIQRIPTALHPRNKVDENAQGAGFMAEWRQKRGLS